MDSNYKGHQNNLASSNILSWLEEFFNNPLLQVLQLFENIQLHMSEIVTMHATLYRDILAIYLFIVLVKYLHQPDQLLNHPDWLLNDNPVAVKCNLIFQSLNSVLECGEECFVSWISQLVPCPGVTHDQLTLILAQHKHWSWSAWDTLHFETWCGHSNNQILYWQPMNWM